MYPALKRLHMTLLCEDAEVGFPWWAANAPQLGWLRINTVHRVAEFDVRIVSQLAHVLGTPSSTTSAPVLILTARLLQAQT